MNREFGYNPYAAEPNSAETPQIDKTIAFVDASEDNDQRAKDIAEAELLAEKEEINNERTWKNLVPRLWKNFAFSKKYEYARQKRIAEVKKRMEETGSWYATEDTAKDTASELESVMERFVKEADGETRHGEQKGTLEEILGPERLATTNEVKNTIKDLISKYATGEIATREDFIESRNRQFNAIEDLPDAIKGQVLGQADNMFRVAETARTAFEHHKSLDDLDLDFEIIVAKAKTGVRSKAELNAVDKVVDKLKSTWLGKFVDESTLAGAVAIAYTAGAVAVPAIARSRAVAWGTAGVGAVIGGGFAGLRESKRLKEERSLHARERAQGKTIKEGSKRREEMEQYIHKTIPAAEAAKSMEALIKANGEYSNEELQYLVSALSEIDSRIQTSDRHNIDLIRYSDVKQVERERLELDIVRAKAKAEISRLVKDGRMAVPEEFSTLEQYYGSIVDAKSRSYLESKETTDNAFNKFKRKKVAWAAAKAVVIGGAVGAVAQEARALVHPGETGLIEGGLLGKDVEYAVTPAEWLRSWSAGEIAAGEPGPVSTSVAESATYAGGGQIGPEGMPLIIDGEKTVSPEEYMQQNPGFFEKVHRTLWYDNNTPKPVFDKNELKLWWGGDKNTGLTDEGDFVFDISHMKAKGSYHGEFNVDAQNAMKEGKIKLLLSLSEKTQTQVVELEVGPDGQVIIPKDSATAKLFFELDGKGKAVFKGRFAEVAEVMGEKDGVDQVRLLATYEGKGVDEIAQNEIPPAVSAGMPQESAGKGPDDFPIYPPPIIPIHSRREMESMQNPEETVVPPSPQPWENLPNYLSTYFGENLANEKDFKERRSSAFENPDVVLDPDIESENYFKNQSAEWNDELNNLAEQINEPMDPDCKVAVFIPVAGHQEGENIYKTLEWYSKQENSSGKPLDPKNFEILLFVNHPKDVNPDKTLDEISRFQNDFPELKIRTVYKPLERDEAKIGTIRKYAADLVLKRQMDSGVKGRDVILVSNDADSQGISSKYIENFIAQFENHEDIDAVLGKIDWEPAAYVRSPLLHVGTRLFQYIDAINRHPKDHKYKSVGSSGANFAFKSSMYAAVGGYIEGDPIAEDKHLGQMIKSARKGSKVYPIGYGHNNSLIYTNARRGVDAINKGLSPAEQWSDQFGADDKLREMAWQLPDGENVREQLEDPDNLEKMRAILERFINRTFQLYQISPDSKDAKKALGFLGVEIEIEDDKAKIVGMNRLVAQLKRYQDEGMRIYGKKLGLEKNELAETLDKRTIVLEDVKKIARAHVEATKRLSAKAAERELKRSEQLEKVIQDWENGGDDWLTTSKEQDLRYQLIQAVDVLENEGIDLGSILVTPEATAVPSSEADPRLSAEYSEALQQLEKIGPKIEIPEDSVFNEWSLSDKLKVIKNLNRALGRLNDKNDKLRNYLLGVSSLRLDSKAKNEQNGEIVYLSVATVEDGKLTPELLLNQRFSEGVEYALRNAWQKRGSPLADLSRMEDRVKGLDLILKTFPTVRAEHNKIIKIPQEAREEGLRNFIKASSTLIKYPSDVKVNLGTKYEIKPGEVTIDITKSYDKIKNQLHAGLRRADPNKSGRVTEKLGARTEQRNNSIDNEDIEEQKRLEKEKEVAEEYKKSFKEYLKKSEASFAREISKSKVKYRKIKSEADGLIDKHVDLYEAAIKERNDGEFLKSSGKARYIEVSKGKGSVVYEFPKGFSKLYIWDRKLGEMKDMVEAVNPSNLTETDAEMEKLKAFVKNK